MDCVKAIRDAAGGELSDEELTDIIEAVMKRRDTLKAKQPALSDLEAITQASKELGDEERLAAAIEKRNALLNMAARQARRSRVEDAVGAIAQRSPKRAASAVVDALRAELHGINTPTVGGRFSAQAEWKALEADYVSIVRDLEKSGLLPTVRRGDLDRQWAAELFELSKGPEGKPGVSGSKEARDIAETIHRYQTRAKEDANKAGAWIGDYPGYIAHTAHDPDKIRRAGYETWRDATQPKLDEKTFNGVDDRNKFMFSVWRALVDGVHLTQDGATGFKDPAFTGPGNLAKRLSQERILHFKDADAWLDYQNQFGQGRAFGNVLNSLSRSARSTALLRRFGTNPAAEFENDIRYFQEKYHLEPDEMSRDRVQALKSAEPGLRAVFAQLDGSANIPVNRLGAKIGSLVRLDESMAKLGGVALTHLSAGMTRAAELRHHGIGFLESYGNYFRSFLEGRGRGEMRDVADELHAGLDGLVNDIRAQFDPDDGLPGRASRISNAYFKATGLTYLYNAMRTGSEFALSRNLGRQIGTAWEGLPDQLRTMLEAYGLNREDWDALRTAPDHVQANGRVFLTPQAAMRTPLPEAEQHALAMKLHAYFTDSSSRAMITPGVREKAILLGDARPGTYVGEFRRFVAQFKQWPTALITQGLGREIYTSPTWNSAVGGILHMALAGAAFGYLRMVANDYASGRNPRPPNDPRTWVAALAQGGGLGIFGDFLFGEASRMGGSPAQTVAGPVLGDGLMQLMNIWNAAKGAVTGNTDQARSRQAKDAAVDAFRLAASQAPFTNLPYVRLGWDYLFLHSVMEAMNPGYLRRYEQRVKQQTGQTFWLSPSSSHL